MTSGGGRAGDEVSGARGWMVVTGGARKWGDVGSVAERGGGCDMGMGVRTRDRCETYKRGVLQDWFPSQAGISQPDFPSLEEGHRLQDRGRQRNELWNI